MKISEIPPFKPKVTVAVQPAQAPAPAPAPAPAFAIPESAKKDIPLATSPTPSMMSQGSQHAKLNPNASSFVFKPNPAAAAFKPGQPSTLSSPVKAPPMQLSPSGGPGPSSSKNPFFATPPQPPKGLNMRDDFNPWKHAQSIPAASSISPQWPYTGRRSSAALIGGPQLQMNPSQGFEDDSSSPASLPPHLVPGMPPNFPPYYRYQVRQFGFILSNADKSRACRNTWGHKWAAVCSHRDRDSSNWVGRCNRQTTWVGRRQPACRCTSTPTDRLVSCF